jgi:hypothetical protein
LEDFLSSKNFFVFQTTFGVGSANGYTILLQKHLLFLIKYSINVDVIKMILAGICSKSLGAEFAGFARPEFVSK